MSSIIYKFIPCERLTYFEDELLRITQPADLNDPFEFLPAIPTNEDFAEVLKKFYQDKVRDIDKLKIDKKQKSELKNIQLREYKTQIRKLKNNEDENIKSVFLQRSTKNINSNIGILSLTKRWDSTLMWSHYTNSHKGLCIGFDAKAQFFSHCREKEDKDKIFMPVTYRDERIKVPIEKGVSIANQVIFSKSKDWEYEEEERLIVLLKHASKVIPFKPYDIYLYKVSHSLIKEVILGINFQKDKIELIKSFCLTQNIDLFRSKISETKYDMEREKV